MIQALPYEYCTRCQRDVPPQLLRLPSVCVSCSRYKTSIWSIHVAAAYALLLGYDCADVIAECSKFVVSRRTSIVLRALQAPPQPFRRGNQRLWMPGERIGQDMVFDDWALHPITALEHTSDGESFGRTNPYTQLSGHEVWKPVKLQDPADVEQQLRDWGYNAWILRPLDVPRAEAWLNGELDPIGGKPEAYNSYLSTRDVRASRPRRAAAAAAETIHEKRTLRRE